MLTVILPGYSFHNKEWADQVKEHLRIKGEIEVIEWEHWKTGKSMSMKKETERILKFVGKEPVNFIAKSVGTRVVMKLIPSLINQINKVILCGIPASPDYYKEGITKLNPNDLLIFQNSQDPFKSFAVIETGIHQFAPEVIIREKPAKSHDYPYWEDFQKFLTK